MLDEFGVEAEAILTINFENLKPKVPNRLELRLRLYVTNFGREH